MMNRLLAASVAALAIGVCAPLQAQTAPAEGGTAATAAPAAESDTSPTATDESTEAGAADVSAETVVATVDGTPITLGHVIAMRTRLPEQYQQLPDDALFQGLLDQLIQQAALGAETETLSRGAELVLENERRALIANEVLAQAATAAVTEEAIQAAYEQQYSAAEPQTEWNASHILVETEEEAQEVLSELEGGADFATLARERSVGPSGPNDGALGWFSTGTMIKPFEDAVAALEPGQVSAPVQTQFGWHVIKLNETREQDAPALEAVRDEIAAGLQQSALEAAVAEATAAAEVERPDLTGIDPSVIRDTSLIQN